MAIPNNQPNELELDIINEHDLVDMDIDLVEGSLELPPDLDDEVVEVSDHHEQAAIAQEATDRAIEAGDYQAAAELRETAETEAGLAGNQDMLHGADSLDLQTAAEHQEQARELEIEQAEHAQAGDYEAALQDARNAADEMHQADERAGGSDHAAQAELEANNMEWADWHQQMADDMVASAIDYAADGDLDAAESCLEEGLDQHTVADHYGDLGEHGHPIADTAPMDPIESHPVETYTPIDTTIDTDTSTTDCSMDG